MKIYSGIVLFDHILSVIAYINSPRVFVPQIFYNEINDFMNLLSCWLP